MVVMVERSNPLSKSLIDGIMEQCPPVPNGTFGRGTMERLSELESENLMSRLWEGQWERIILEPFCECSEQNVSRAGL